LAIATRLLTLIRAGRSDKEPNYWLVVLRSE
jgi:hypothetical protein